MKNRDVFGIGNPLVDLLLDVDDAFLSSLHLNKGSSHLLDKEKYESIWAKLDQKKIKLAFGDSTANTMVGLANLGAKVSYLGKSGDDEYGKKYEYDLTRRGIISKIKKNPAIPTGKVIAFNTPDAERTFIVYLGATLTLTPQDLDKEDVKAAKILHLTGYQLEDMNLRKTAMEAMAIAKTTSTRISIDLADAGLITRNLEFLKSMVEKYADILFLNETEAKAFTGKEPEDAVTALQDTVETVCVKIGDKGSIISHHGMLHYIKPQKIIAQDTSGAGDMYAACILFGLLKSMDLQDAGELASRASALVVEQKGPRLEYPLSSKKEIAALLSHVHH